MGYIQDAIDENQKIKPGTFCNVPESEITIPIKENVDYYVKQYPIAHHALPEIEKQLNEWLDAGIIEQCRPNGLFNSPLICSWFRSSIYLLGFVVGPHVSKVDMRRLSDIDHWGPCKSAKQVKQLTGLISYLRPHIPMLAKVMAHIDALRNDPDTGSKWTDEHTKRLEIIKKVLLSEALLTAPDMNKKFYLHL